MGKSSGLAVFALLIGVGGIAFGAYSYFIFNDKIAELNSQLKETSVRGTWYSENLDDWSPTSVNTNETIPLLTITFEVNQGESVYFLFITRTIIYSNSLQTFMRFTFRIDGVILNEPFSIAGGYDIDDYYTYIPVALQYSTDTLATGSHTVSVMALKSYSFNFIRQSTLLIQTYV